MTFLSPNAELSSKELLNDESVPISSTNEKSSKSKSLDSFILIDFSLVIFFELLCCFSIFDKINFKSCFNLDSSSEGKFKLPSLRALEIYLTSPYNFSSKSSELKLIELSFLEVETLFFVFFKE